MAAVRRHFGNRIPFLIAEPGRGLVGDAGVLQTEVVLIAARATAMRGPGSISMSASSAASPRPMDEAIRYRSAAPHGAGPAGPCILAGPTCDSADVLYERSGYALP